MQVWKSARMMRSQPAAALSIRRESLGTMQLGPTTWVSRVVDLHTQEAPLAWVPIKRDEGGQIDVCDLP